MFTPPNPHPPRSLSNFRHLLQSRRFHRRRQNVKSLLRSCPPDDTHGLPTAAHRPPYKIRRVGHLKRFLRTRVPRIVNIYRDVIDPMTSPRPSAPSDPRGGGWEGANGRTAANFAHCYSCRPARSQIGGNGFGRKTTTTRLPWRLTTIEIAEVHRVSINNGDDEAGRAPRAATGRAPASNDKRPRRRLYINERRRSRKRRRLSMRRPTGPARRSGPARPL